MNFAVPNHTWNAEVLVPKLLPKLTPSERQGQDANIFQGDSETLLFTHHYPMLSESQHWSPTHLPWGNSLDRVPTWINSPNLTIYQSSLVAQTLKSLPVICLDPWVGKITWRRKWQPTPGFLPGKSHGPRRLPSYSPWSFKDSDMTEQLTQHWSFVKSVTADPFLLIDPVPFV